MMLPRELLKQLISWNTIQPRNIADVTFIMKNSNSFFLEDAWNTTEDNFVSIENI